MEKDFEENPNKPGKGVFRIQSTEGKGIGCIMEDKITMIKDNDEYIKRDTGKYGVSIVRDEEPD